MRAIDELDYYELLEVSPTATTDEIERAYRLSQQTYADGSLALYSVFETSDAGAIRERIDEAFRVLSDPEDRAAYDASRPAKPEPPLTRQPGAAAEREAEAPSPVESYDDVVEDYEAFEDDGSGDFDGARLRRARLFRGYELDHISDVTKIRVRHLRNIEEENFEALPADVYVRGFVTAYAQTIGLDPKSVAPSYMARVQSVRSAGSRGRFLARH
jgi:flagellar biosynthesis protein FlhG